MRKMRKKKTKRKERKICEKKNEDEVVEEDEKEEEEDRMSSRIRILIAHSRFSFDVSNHESLMMHMKQGLMWKMMRMRMMITIHFIGIRIERFHSMFIIHIAIEIHCMCFDLKRFIKQNIVDQVLYSMIILNEIDTTYVFIEMITSHEAFSANLTGKSFFT
jgi:hypothetical protein